MLDEVNKIVTASENWIKKPVVTDLKDSIVVSNDLLNRLQNLMLQEVSLKKKIGPLIGRIKKIQKSINSIELMNWVSILNGHLSIGHRPSSKLGVDLNLQNTTHMLTLLSEKEGGKKMQTMAKQNNIEWLWFPMESANLPSEEKINDLANLFSKMESILKNNGKIYIHCSAGIHRTGMISYSFLRFIGNDLENSIEILDKLRITTKEGMGQKRIEWGNSIYAILRKYKEKNDLQF